MPNPVLACILRRPTRPKTDPYLASLVAVARAMQGKPGLLRAFRAIAEAKRRQRHV